MSLRRIGIASLAAVALVAASMIGLTGAASGASTDANSAAGLHVSGSTANPRVLVTFPVDDWGQFAESMVADHDGNLFVSVTAWKGEGWNKGQVWKITPRGIVTKYGPELDVGMITGLALDEHGRLYAGLSTWGDPSYPPGVLRIDASGSSRVLALPSGDWGIAAMPNGLAFRGETLYVSDSTHGAIWRTRPHGNVNDVQSEPWIQNALLAPSVGWEGINGIAIDATGIEAVVADVGLVVRIPIMRNGAPGTPRILASDPALVNADGVTFARDGSLWVVTNGGAAFTGSIVKVSPRGHVTVVVQDPGWLDYPSQPVFGTTHATEDTLYIANGGLNNSPGSANVIAWHVDIDAHH